MTDGRAAFGVGVTLSEHGGHAGADSNGHRTAVLDSQPTANVVVIGGRALGHGRAPGPDHPDVHVNELGDGADGDAVDRGHRSIRSR